MGYRLPHQLEIPFTPWGPWSGHLHNIWEYISEKMQAQFEYILLFFYFVDGSWLLSTFLVPKPQPMARNVNQCRTVPRWSHEKMKARKMSHHTGSKEFLSVYSQQMWQLLIVFEQRYCWLDKWYGIAKSWHVSLPTFIVCILSYNNTIFYYANH